MAPKWRDEVGTTSLCRDMLSPKGGHAMLRMLVSIPSDTALTLYELAEEERRTPREQAAVMLTQVIKRRQQQAQRRRAPQREREVARVAS
jgi:hypothetical protein